MDVEVLGQRGVYEFKVIFSALFVRNLGLAFGSLPIVVDAACKENERETVVEEFLQNPDLPKDLFGTQSLEVFFSLAAFVVQDVISGNFKSTDFLDQLPVSPNQEFCIYPLGFGVLVRIKINSLQAGLSQFFAKAVIAHHSKIKETQHLSKIMRFFSK